mmetsp:Transcript_50133/g.112853  ORF Transcript_50133/g.112853 Transcript_50133/m.112853 type:complete len:168 (-) Transcript_50133:144-647(-)
MFADCFARAFTGGLDVVSIACVGDSLTEDGYPKFLQGLLEEKAPDVSWDVRDCGWSGTTASFGSDAYVHYPGFQEVLKTNADIIIVLLGTNDSKRRIWSGPESFRRDYTRLVEMLQRTQVLGGVQPQLVLAIPPPLLRDGVWGMQKDVVSRILPALLREVGSALGTS